MTFRKRISAAAAGCATMLVLSVLPASAAVKVHHDPAGDSISGYDLTRTAFRNAPRRISVTAHVVGLQRQRASFQFYFGSTSTRLDFVARTFLGRDGKRTTLKNLFVISNDPTVPHLRPCDVRAAWRLIEDTVTLSVPQSCIRKQAGRLSMSALIFGRGEDVGDKTRWVELRRG